jgi:hypothetical protein
MFLEGRAENRCRLRPDDPLDYLPAAEDEKRGNASDIETL